MQLMYYEDIEKALTKDFKANLSKLNVKSINRANNDGAKPTISWDLIQIDSDLEGEDSFTHNKCELQCAIISNARDGYSAKDNIIVNIAPKLRQLLYQYDIFTNFKRIEYGLGKDKNTMDYFLIVESCEFYYLDKEN